MGKAFRLCMVALSLCACLGGAGAQAWAQSYRQITDVTGRSVRVPTSPRRIVVTCYGGASHEVAVLGDADKLIAQPSMARFPLLYKIYPGFRGVRDVGSFENVSVEQLMMIKPDLVIAAVISPRANALIESMGVPVVQVMVGRADTESLLREFTVMGTVLGRQAQAAELTRYWRERLAWLRIRTQKIPMRARKRVLYLSSGNSVGPLTSGGWGHDLVTLSGGVDVVASSKLSGNLSIEQLVAWNPDAIVINGSNSSTKLLEKNPQTARTLVAVQRNAVYHSPIGAFWWDRPSPEAILGVLWLAKTLYPAQMKDLNLRAEAAIFYRKFYRHQLTPAEYDAMFRAPGAAGGAR